MKKIINKKVWMKNKNRRLRSNSLRKLSNILKNRITRVKRVSIQKLKLCSSLQCWKINSRHREIKACLALRDPNSLTTILKTSLHINQFQIFRHTKNLWIMNISIARIASLKFKNFSLLHLHHQREWDYLLLKKKKTNR